MPYTGIIAPILIFVAAAYASVGLGGGTAYLSILSFVTSDPETLRPVAWWLNIVVALIGMINFRKKGHFNFGAIWHYLVGGVAGAIVGAAIPISHVMFIWLLAVTLTALAIQMLISKKSGADPEREGKEIFWPLGLLLGFFPGLISGLVGIGGGIILGPIILALGLLPVKRTAALTATYILVVSIGALSVHFVTGGTLPWKDILLFSVVVIIGGYGGSKYGAGKASPKTLKRIFGVIVLFAALNLLLKAMGISIINI